MSESIFRSKRRVAQFHELKASLKSDLLLISGDYPQLYADVWNMLEYAN